VRLRRRCILVAASVIDGMPCACRREATLCTISNFFKEKMLNGLDLFTGIGGLSIALREWVRPIAYCEIDPYCQAVLLTQQSNGRIPTSPIWDDVLTFPANGFAGAVDIIYGGFPCQDISVAGHGKGLEGERSGLFFEIVRLAKEIKPHFIFLENVPAITSRGGLQVVETIAEMGYDCRWCVISAASVGALHKRERWFLLAHSKSTGFQSRRNGIRNEARESLPSNLCENEKYSHICDAVPYATSLRRDERASERVYPERKTSINEKSSYVCDAVPYTTSPIRPRLPSREREEHAESRVCGQYASIDEWQEAVSSVCRVTDGIPNRVDRIRALGNAVVPSQAKEAFKILMGLK